MKDKDLKDFILLLASGAAGYTNGNFATSTAVSPARNFVPSER